MPNGSLPSLSSCPSPRVSCAARRCGCCRTNASSLSASYGGDVRLAVSSIARGNGKTGLIAGLVLCHLIGPEAEPRGEIYSAACTSKQASLVFAEVEAILKAVPEFLQFRVKVTSFWRNMEVGTAAWCTGPSTPCCRAKRKPPMVWRRHCGYTTSSALRQIGNCSTHYRRQAVSARARSVSPFDASG